MSTVHAHLWAGFCLRLLWVSLHHVIFPDEKKNWDLQMLSYNERKKNWRKNFPFLIYRWIFSNFQSSCTLNSPASFHAGLDPFALQFYPQPSF